MVCNNKYEKQHKTLKVDFFLFLTSVIFKIILLKMEVDGKAVGDYIQEIMTTFATNETIKGLPLLAFKQKAIDLCAAINALQSGVATWTLTLDFATNRTAILAVSDRVDELMAQVARYETCFHGVEKEELSQKESTTLAHTKARDAISRGLRAAGIPASLAKVIADSYTSPPGAETMYVVPTSATVISVDALRQPLLLEYKADAIEGESYLHKSARDFFTAALAPAQEKVAQKTKTMFENGTRHYHCLLEAPVFQWNANDTNQLVQVADVKPVLHIFGSNCFDGRPIASPLQAQRQVATCVTGVVVCVLSETVQAIMSKDWHSTVIQAHHTFFASKQVLIMQAGDTVLIPIGQIATFIGLRWSAKDGRYSIPGSGFKFPATDGPLEDFSSVLVSAPFDPALDLNHCPEVTSLAVAAFRDASVKLPVPLKSAKAVKEWDAALFARAPEEAV